MTQSPSERERTAYHEAGHAVAAVFLHAPIKTVTIEEDRDSLGKVDATLMRRLKNPDVEVTPYWRVQMEKNIILLLAGFEAERRFDPEGAQSEYASDDHQGAMTLAGYLTGSDATLEAYVAYVDVCARELIETHWAEIEAVAAALLKTPTLRGPAIREIVMGLHRPMPDPKRSEVHEPSP